MVVTVGETTWVPPSAARLYELPSDPLILTCDEFVTFTVSVEEPPERIDDGLALMLTVGAAAAVTVTVAVAEALPPVPLAKAVYVVVFDGLTLWVPPVEASA